MIFELSSLELPYTLGIERGLPSGVVVENDEFFQGYDKSTLFYDCFFDPDLDRVKLYAPSLLNFEKKLGVEGLFSGDGSPLSWRLTRYRCFDVIEVEFSKFPSSIGISFSNCTQAALVQKQSREQFSGRKVLCAVSKNNDLKWIRDWVRYHQINHGVDSVLIVDNGSSAYSLDELSSVLSKVVDGNFGIVTAPLPYGPSIGARSGLGRAKFFQTGMLNLVRDRFLAYSAGVLSVDIDELVVSKSGRSIFECLENSRLGFLAFEGGWRYPENHLAATHGEHFWVADDDQACPSKYCYRPKSFLGKQALSVHGLQRVSRRWMPSSKEFYFAHCRNISTGWKWGRERKLAFSSKDEHLIKALQFARLNADVQMAQI
jgi:hypothetical protein